MAESSYNGWPASPDKASIGVVSSDVFPGGAKSGDVTTVLGYVATQLHERVESCIDGWCWGYTYKTNANNPSQLSCHASGTAFDFNAPEHSNGSSGTFSPAQVTTIYTILAEVEGAVSWLEGYDEMHFEICVDAATLSGVAARLGGSTPPPDKGDNPLADLSQADADKIGAAVAKAVFTYAAAYALKDSKGGEAQKKTTAIGLFQDQATHLSRTSYNTDQINKKT